MKPSMISIAFFLFTAQISAQSIYIQPGEKNTSQKAQFIGAKLSPAGDIWALSAADKTVKLIDVSSLNEKASLIHPTQKSYGVSFSNDGRMFFTGTPDGNISVWDVSRAVITKTFSHGSSVRCVDADKSGRLISSGSDRTIKMWDVTTGSQIAKFPTVSSEISVLAFSPDARTIVAGGVDGTISIFDAGTAAVLKTMSDKRSQINAIAYSSDGKYFAMSHSDSTVTVWNGLTGVLIKSLRSTAGSVTSIAFHPNNKYLISAASVISFWDIASENVFHTISDTAFKPAFIAVSQQKNILAAASRTGELRSFLMLEKKPDLAGPVITITSPRSTAEEPVKIFSSEIEITGIVSDESAVKEVLVNGTPAATAPATAEMLATMGTAQNAVSFTAVVPLTAAGANTIAVTASDGGNNSSSAELLVTKLTKDAAVELVNPKENVDTDQISLDLQFKVWFDFTSYTVQLNTIEIAKKENFPKKPSGALRTEKLSLSAGLNQIQLAVNGRNGERIRKTINITRRTMGAPTTLSENKVLKNTTGQPQRWAVIVGVSEYGNPAIKNLAYADRDAKAFAEFLKSPAGGGFEEDRVKMLVNKDATLQNVKQALYNFLRQTVDKDLVVIYFAGHGAPEPANPNNNYLLCYDTDPNSLETTGFPMWDINTALTRYIPSKRVVVFTDACHSGGISSDIATRGMSTTDGNLINQYLTDLSKTKEGIIVFTASQAGEVSQELEKFGHGVFTYYLLEGMNGKADFNNDYTVTIGELMDYVEEKVKRQTNGNQHPTRNQGSYDKDLTISLIPN